MSRTILLVEDNEDLRAVVAELLGDEGYNVRLAATGQEVLDLLAGSFRPSCMILDLGLPDMSSLDFLERFEKISGSSDLPIILASGSPEIANWAKRFKAGRVIRKPYDLDSLVSAVSAHCQNSRLATSGVAPRA